MNKSSLLVMATLLLTISFVSCGRDPDRKKEGSQDVSLQEFIVLKKSNSLDFYTKYHLKGVKPYNLGRGDGTSYPSDTYYFFFNDGNISNYAACRVVVDGTYKYEKGRGFVLTDDEYHISSIFETSPKTKDADVNCTFDIDVFYIRFSTYSNLACEVISYTKD